MYPYRQNPKIVLHFYEQKHQFNNNKFNPTPAFHLLKLIINLQLSTIEIEYNI